jgi:zinc protease
LIAIPRKHPDYMSVNLATKILGGEGANRLQNVLRSERGLTYGASADMNALKQGGAIIARTDTQTSTTGEALRLTVDEFSRLARERVGDRELAGAQAYLAGSFPLGLETADEIALQVLNVLFYDLDVRDVETYPERVTAVSADDIQRVAKTFVMPDRLSIVLVGDARQVLPQLKQVGFEDVEVVPIAELDLTDPTLRRRAPAAR